MTKSYVEKWKAKPVLCPHCGNEYTVQYKAGEMAQVWQICFACDKLYKITIDRDGLAITEAK